MAKKSKQQSKLQNLVDDSAKTLLANIRFMSVDDPIKTIAITSSIPNEGKTFVSVNLAKAIASSGKTCLLMEGDLRKRSVATAIFVHPPHGIYAALSGEFPLDEVIASTPLPNLFFLDAEPHIPNPPDFFNSKRFADLLDTLANRFDYVIIDTPPVSTFVDAAVVASHVDATFLVVRQNFTKRNFIRYSCEQLDKAGAIMGGIVMNACDSSNDESYNYYGYYDYSSKGSAHGKAVEPGRTVFDNSGAGRKKARFGRKKAQDGASIRQAPNSPSSVDSNAVTSQFSRINYNNR